MDGLSAQRSKCGQRPHLLVMVIIAIIVSSSVFTGCKPECVYLYYPGISALGNYMWSLKSYLPSDWVYQLFTTARNILAVYNLWTHVHLIIRLIFAGNVKVSPIVDFFTYLLLLGTQSMKAVKNIVHHLKAKMDPVVVLSVLDMLWASMDPEVMMSVLDRLTATVDPEVVMKVIETIVGTIDPVK